MSGTSAITQPINVRIDNDLKRELDVILARSGRTLTSLFRRFIERFVAANKEAPGSAQEEVVIFLTQAQYADAAWWAGGEAGVSRAATQVVVKWAGERKVIDLTVNYPGLPRLAEAAREGLDKVLEAYSQSPPFDGDLAELLAGVMRALPVREVVGELTRRGIRGRGGRT